MRPPLLSSSMGQDVWEMPAKLSVGGAVEEGVVMPAAAAAAASLP